ncbi:gram negative bacteria binding protein 2 [Basidiobolus meristosporus CBS 931.73]|uniref:Gram negative bacteria binding protein 2 n=1 Tax=Basidiobolus meristosporus CBS 931.73 TaxID=1314790 RepID=A0A1Y1W1G7_9FUNG|nr:gram negative bacteria binding protein 2 [Basidiobolus meristosporus CBS 931.73]|eukprot:ORX67351.1 gram negative bacteria binding protein 2 [Basidiobolus meristosporus CBS 931.73]
MFPRSPVLLRPAGFLAFLLLLAFAQVIAARQLVFQDDFDTFDVSVWRHDITLSGGGNWEFEYYYNNRSNSYVEDGVLYIKPTLTADRIGEAAVMNGGTIDLWGSDPANACTGNAFYGCKRSSNGNSILNPIQSALVRSYNSMNLKYGKVEIRARLPRGDWIWQAIWMLPKYEQYGPWPASGEIDIVESRGNAGGYPDGLNTISSTLHWGPSSVYNQYLKTTAKYTLPGDADFSQDFHIFTLEWDSTSIKTSVDNNQVLEVPIKESFWQRGNFPSDFNNPWEGRGNDAPFDQEFYLIFNVAVGGVNGYFPEHPTKPWSNQSPVAAKEFWLAKDEWLKTWPDDEYRALAIDYVKVWSE